MRTIFVFFIFVSLCSAQNGEIYGKLLIANNEFGGKTVGETYVVFQSESKTDSVKVNEKLEFSIKNLKAETYNLSISPRSYPTRQSFKIKLKDSEKVEANLPYSPVCPYKEEKTNCPKCNSQKDVIPISYGMGVVILSPKERKQGKKIQKTKAGGCIISDCQPNWHCEKDNIDF